MEVFSDLLFGEFKASDYGLIPGSFGYNGESTDAIGMSPSTIEEYIGHNPVPVYLGQQYSKKLEFQLSLIKNPCYCKDGEDYFTEKDCRSILRVVTGQKGYQWTKLFVDDPDEDLWYKARVNNVEYERVSGKIVGIILYFECDSQFAWSIENNIFIKAKANVPFSIYNNTDDLNNYVLPSVRIHCNSAKTVNITNQTDNWTTQIKFTGNETINMDSKNELVKSNLPSHSLILNDTNLHFIRLVPDKNTFLSDSDVNITFTFRVPRKVGFTQ